MQKTPDISINGQMGFYMIQPFTDDGREWLIINVPDAWPYWPTPCDDTRMAQDIADGASDEGLLVEVNGRQYLGNGCSA